MKYKKNNESCHPVAPLTLIMSGILLTSLCLGQKFHRWQTGPNSPQQPFAPVSPSLSGKALKGAIRRVQSSAKLTNQQLLNCQKASLQAEWQFSQPSHVQGSPEKGLFYIENRDSLKQLKKVQFPLDNTRQIFDKPVVSYQLSQNHDWLAALLYPEKEIKIIDTKTHKEQQIRTEKNVTQYFWQNNKLYLQTEDSQSANYSPFSKKITSINELPPVPQIRKSVFALQHQKQLPSLIIENQKNGLTKVWHPKNPKNSLCMSPPLVIKDNRTTHFDLYLSPNFSGKGPFVIYPYHHSHHQSFSALTQTLRLQGYTVLRPFEHSTESINRAISWINKNNLGSVLISLSVGLTSPSDNIKTPHQAFVLSESQPNNRYLLSLEEKQNKQKKWIFVNKNPLQKKGIPEYASLPVWTHDFLNYLKPLATH